MLVLSKGERTVPVVVTGGKVSSIGWAIRRWGEASRTGGGRSMKTGEKKMTTGRIVRQMPGVLVGVLAAVTAACSSGGGGGGAPAPTGIAHVHVVDAVGTAIPSITV